MHHREGGACGIAAEAMSEDALMIDREKRPLVYVVDDDEAVRDSLETYLALKGLSVVAFASGRELLDGEPDDGPEILIIDVNMPDIDGLSLLEALRGRGVQAPAIVVTGLGDGDLRERAARAGAADFFDKPVDPRALVRAILRLLGDQ
jgi:FixJ family two-component response regulator